MKKTGNSLDCDLKSFRKSTFLSFTPLLLIAVLFFSPLPSAGWGAEEYTITYEFNMGGTNHIDNPTKYSTSTVDIPILPASKPGYKFMGWAYLFDNGTQEVVNIDPDYKIPAGSFGALTLTAIFDTTPLSYDIEYILNGGQNNPVTEKLVYFADYDFFPIAISEPYKGGYNFVGWTVQFFDGQSDIAEPTRDFKIEKGTTGKITLTAHWSNPINYNITYVLNGGTHSGPSTYNVEELPRSIGSPTYAGHNFLRWAAWCSVNGSFIDLPTSVIPTGTYGDITLNARWTVPDGGPYTVYHYDAVNGNVLHVEYPISTAGTTVTANVRTFFGYTFASGDSRNVLSGIASADGTLELKVYYTPTADVREWYTLTYNGNGHTTGSAPVDSLSPYYEGTLVAILGQGNMIRAGYSFLGWALSPTATSPTFTTGSTFSINNNMLLYAVWTNATYTVAYQPGTHGTFGTQITSNLHYGDPTPTAPTVTGDAGWNFTGWSPAPSTTVIGDATYVAQWTLPSSTTPTPSISASVPITPIPSMNTSPTLNATTTPVLTPAPTKDLPPVSEAESKWSIVNLLVSVIGVILALITVLFVLLLKRKSDKQNTAKNMQQYRQYSFLWLASTVVLAVIGIVAFLVTQNLSFPFGWIVDKWTVVNAAILVVECITIWLCLKTANND